MAFCGRDINVNAKLLGKEPRTWFSADCSAALLAVLTSPRPFTSSFRGTPTAMSLNTP